MRFPPVWGHFVYITYEILQFGIGQLGQFQPFADSRHLPWTEVRPNHSLHVCRDTRCRSEHANSPLPIASGQNTTSLSRPKCTSVQDLLRKLGPLRTAREYSASTGHGERLGRYRKQLYNLLGWAWQGISCVDRGLDTHYHTTGCSAQAIPPSKVAKVRTQERSRA